jgi:hypothetical protein
MQLLLNENVAAHFQAAIVQAIPHLTILRVGEPDAPPKGTLDPEILAWCENHNCVLLTNNRRSMPPHLAEHLRQGGHLPGLLVFDREAPLSTLVEDLQLILAAERPEELADQIRYLPLP